MPSIQAPTKNYVTQGKHGRYNAVDNAGRTSRWIPVMNSRKFYATEDGTITNYGDSGACGNRLELTSTDKKRRWGFCHLTKPYVKKGQKVKRGQLIGLMGHTGLTDPDGYYGTHLHTVCYTGGKYVYPPNLYNASFRIYSPSKFKMPKVGSTIILTSGSRTTFKNGTTRVAGRIKNPKNWSYKVRGYDRKYKNRIIINTRSGGGDGVALALYFTSGKRISGWKSV